MTRALVRSLAWAGLLLAAAAPAPGQARLGVVAGQALDAGSGAPLPFVQVLLEEAGRSATSGADGRFVLGRLPAGPYTLRAYRIGYARLTEHLDVRASDTTRVVLRLSAEALEMGEIVVEGGADDDAVQAALALEGGALRRQLASTVAATLADDPAVAMRSMGPAPARPVVRGLGGERLLVLEDGATTGDLSATSSDHALVVDPLTAERLEVIRGPAALAHGPAVLGGVVNVVRGGVPAQRPQGPEVRASLQAQSVARAGAAGMTAAAPLGRRAAVRADASYRDGGDVRTPLGRLGNTAQRTLSASAGSAWLPGWGHAGIAGSIYRSRYGIPGGFVGAHPDGVSIEVEREAAEVAVERLGLRRSVPKLELRLGQARYHHREYEAEGVLGIEYGLLTTHARLAARTARHGGLHEGAIGVQVEHRDYASGGAASTPATDQLSVGVFAIQDVHLGPATLHLGARYDARRVSPRETRDAAIGRIRPRSFGGVSAGAGLRWQPAAGLRLGVAWLRSLRVPGIEELFSEGPHLAAYAFEIGNPDLQREIGHGLESSLEFERGRVEMGAAIYLNRFDRYLFPRATGERNVRNFLPIYQYTGTRARMWGGEGRLGLRLARRWRADASLAWVEGTFVDRDEPMPWMPPPRARAGLRYERRRITLGSVVHAATAQRRLAPGETPTDGYVTLDLFAQLHATHGGVLSTLDVSLDNVLDATYRDHLSRIKDVMPQPGRNLRILYRVHF